MRLKRYEWAGKIVIIARTMALNYRIDLCHHRAHSEANAYEFYASTFIKKIENLFSFPSFQFNCYDERQFSSKALFRDGEERHGGIVSGPLSYDEGCLFE